MDKELFLKKISTALSKKQALALSEEPALSVADLINLTLMANHELAFRAAWVLELVAIGEVERFKEHIPQFSEAYIRQKNKSCQRHFTKIFMYLADGKRDLPDNINLDQLIEITFEWLIDPKTPVAVQCNCMDILFNFKHRSDWLEEELAHQVRFLLKDGSAALQSRGKKLLRKLSSK
jgi:hypothetical protein